MRGKGGGEGGARRLFRGLLRCGGGREVKVGGGLIKGGVKSLDYADFCKLAEIMSQRSFNSGRLRADT